MWGFIKSINKYIHFCWKLNGKLVQLHHQLGCHDTQVIFSEFALEPKAGKLWGWEGGMLSLEGNKPYHSDVATQDAHAMWYWYTISNCARSPSAPLQHLYPVGMRKVRKLPQSTYCQQQRAVLFLWHCEQDGIAWLWLLYPKSAGQHGMIHHWVSRREQRFTSSDSPPGLTCLHLLPWQKAPVATFQYLQRVNGTNRNAVPSSVDSHAWDATTTHCQRPGLGDCKSTRVVMALPDS